MLGPRLAFTSGVCGHQRSGHHLLFSCSNPSMGQGHRPVLVDPLQGANHLHRDSPKQ